MFLTLLAAAVAGLGAAGIGFGLRKISGQRIGKWIIPACAGLGILLYQISYEYSWYSNQLLHKPEAAVVVGTEATPAFFRPWTFFLPLTTAYTLVDPTKVTYQEQAEPKAPIATFVLYRIEKAPSDALIMKKHVLNCETGELIQLRQDNELDPNAKMRVLSKDNALFKAVCH